MNFKIPATIEISAEEIVNLVVSAFEGGYSPWIGAVTQLSGNSSPGVVFYGQEEIYEDRSIKMRVHYDDPNDPEEGIFGASKMIGIDEMLRGLALMAEKRPAHFADVITENDDANTADIFMQLTLLGDVIYG